MEQQAKNNKLNLWMYPLGTVGRDMMYQLFNSFILTYILLTRNLTSSQLLAITAIMIAARFFDAANDPVMGFIIERTRTKWGKFKPWFVIGMLTTFGVIITIFNATVQGWGFVVLFGIIYFLYSITYTMHDISYWGMIPSLSEDANLRNQMTSRATLFAGIGSGLAGMLIPMFTVGQSAIAPGAQQSYGIISIVICIVAFAFGCFTTFGVRETNIPTKENAPKERKKVKEIFKAIAKNKPLLWIIIAFLIQQIGNGFISGGIGSTYIYFRFGYEGGNYSLFSTIGLAASAFLMIFYPMFAQKYGRKKLLTALLMIATFGTLLMGGSSFFGSTQLAFWMVTIGYMFSNFGQFGFYLIMMISIMNTVEYNEYLTGDRDEAIITSVRPFVTKMASGIIVGLTSLSYIIFKVTDYTNKISDLENAASVGTISEADKLVQISAILQKVETTQSTGILVLMYALPFVLLLISYLIYMNKYNLDEEEYERICKEIEARKKEKESK